MFKKRSRFMSDTIHVSQLNTVSMPIATPPSPMIGNLELEMSDLAELEELDLPPSDKFEQNKDGLLDFFSSTHFETRDEDKSQIGSFFGDELELLPLQLPLLRRRSKSCYNSSKRIFDLLGQRVSK